MSLLCTYFCAAPSGLSMSGHWDTLVAQNVVHITALPFS